MKTASSIRCTTLMRFSLVLVCLAMAACATQSKVSTLQDEQRVAVRAQERWEALLNRDFMTAYDYLSPAQRTKLSGDEYASGLKRSKVKWKSALVTKSDCENDVCAVQVQLEVQVVSPVPGVREYTVKQYLEEQWVKSGGEWWLVPK